MWEKDRKSIWSDLKQHIHYWRGQPFFSSSCRFIHTPAAIVSRRRMWKYPNPIVVMSDPAKNNTVKLSTKWAKCCTLFVHVWSFQTSMQTWQPINVKKLTIKYAVTGFKLMKSCSWVSSHIHRTRVHALVLISFTNTGDATVNYGNILMTYLWACLDQ